MTLILAVTFGLILLGQFFLLKNKSKNPPKPESQPAATQTATTESQKATPPSDTTQPSAQNTESPAAATTSERKAAGGEVETVVENDLYKIVFSNKGGQAKSWILKKYKDDKGQPLDLVNSAGTQYGLPLGLYTYDDKLRDQLNSALYVPSGQGALTAPGELSYEYSDAGIVVRKTYRFADNYVIGVEVSGKLDLRHAFPKSNRNVLARYSGWMGFVRRAFPESNRNFRISDLSFNFVQFD